MLIQRTVKNAIGQLIYKVIQEHCSHASAAGAFQVIKKDSLISTKLSNSKTTVVLCDGEQVIFEDIKPVRGNCNE
ncbi:hypothetical protein VPHK250G1_0081 [Vibrio phage K250 g1]